jgi:hypothetical protein
MLFLSADFFTMMLEAIRSYETSVLTGATSQKAEFFVGHICFENIAMLNHFKYLEESKLNCENDSKSNPTYYFLQQNSCFICM